MRMILACGAALNSADTETDIFKARKLESSPF